MYSLFLTLSEQSIALRAPAVHGVSSLKTIAIGTRPDYQILKGKVIPDPQLDKLLSQNVSRNFKLLVLQAQKELRVQILQGFWSLEVFYFILVFLVLQISRYPR